MAASLSQGLHGPRGPFLDTLPNLRGGPPSVLPVAVAPPAQEPPARHELENEAAEGDMVATMQQLRLGVVQRNQELEEQLQTVLLRALEARRELAEKIVPAREAGTATQRASLERALRELEGEISAGIGRAFAALKTTMAVPESRMNAALAGEKDFYDRAVPAKNEAQCGAAIRTMVLEKEGMALDVATIRAREAKISERVDAHFAAFRRRAADEVADRKRQHSAFEAQFAADSSAMEASHTRLARELRPPQDALAAAIAAEVGARRAGDAGVLHAMETTMARLRESAIANFGAGDDDEEDEDDDGEAGGKRGGGGAGGGKR